MIKRAVVVARAECCGFPRQALDVCRRSRAEIGGENMETAIVGSGDESDACTVRGKPGLNIYCVAGSQPLPCIVTVSSAHNATISLSYRA